METNPFIFEAARLIISHDRHSSFRDLIEPNLSIFSNFRLMYSSNNTVTNFGYLSLDEIESKCSSIKKFFYGSELLFFSKNINYVIGNSVTSALPFDRSLLAIFAPSTPTARTSTPAKTRLAIAPLAI